MKLAERQADFRARLLGEDDDPRMGVYRNNYRGSLMACLADSFPATNGWEGDEGFAALAARYIDDCPPVSWSLDHYPAGFPGWLERAQADMVTRDLAALEWALAESFVAADEAVLTVAKLGEVDWDAARLRLAASSIVLTTRCNAGAVWAAIEAGEAPEVVMTGEVVLVSRAGEMCRWRVLDGLEAELLEREHLAFSEVCELACAQLGEEAGVARAGALLAQWAQEEALVVI